MAGLTSAADHRLSWDSAGNASFRARLDTLIGEHAVDCGFLDLMLRKASRSQRREAMTCIANARRMGMPFKFGTARAPLDSFVHEVYAQSSTGELWLLVYDEMALSGYVNYSVASCEAVEVDRHTLHMVGKNCSDHADGSAEEP